jgi:hypothetical protein
MQKARSSAGYLLLVSAAMWNVWRYGDVLSILETDVDVDTGASLLLLVRLYAFICMATCRLFQRAPEEAMTSLSISITSTLRCFEMAMKARWTE